MAGPVLAAVSVFGLIQQHKQGKKAEAAARRSHELQVKGQEIATRRGRVQENQARMKALREARIRRAQVMAQESGAEVAGTSATAGAVSSVGAQYGRAITDVNTEAQFGRQLSNVNVGIGEAESSIFAAQNRQAGWQNISNAALNMMANSGKINSAFGI